MKKQYRHIFFDLDGTVTRSRSLISPEMERLMKRLSAQHDVVIVSGATESQIRFQMGKNLVGRYYTLGQNGNYAADKKGNILWENKMNWVQRYEVMHYAQKVIGEELHAFEDLFDLVHDRGCQVSYSLIGHNQAVEKKEKFDPDHAKRKHVLAKMPFVSETIDVKIGGTTCLDFFIKGKNKGSNVQELLKRMKWRKSECLYIGDALFPGGNDEAVVGVVDTKAIENPDGTAEVISDILASEKKLSNKKHVR